MATYQERLSAYSDWIKANQGKQGTPEYVKITEAYRQLRQNPEPMSVAQPSMSEVGSAWKTAGDEAMHMAGRIGTRALVAPADLAALASNKLADGLGWATEKVPALKYVVGQDDGQRLPYASQGLQDAMGIRPQAPDAFLMTKGIENFGDVLLGGRIMGGPQRTLAQDAKNSVLPALGVTAGGELGEAVGGENGRLIGSILGGGGAAVAGNIATRPLSYFGKENAGEIYDAATRQGIRPTAGMVGDTNNIMRLEKGMGSFPGVNVSINRARADADAGIEAARDRAATMLDGGTVNISPGYRGELLINGARDAEGRIQRTISNAQEALEQGIGSTTPVMVQPLMGAGANAVRATDIQNSVPILARLEQLRSMTPEGSNARDPTAPINTVPYGVMKDFRTNLRTASEGMDPVSGHLQAPIYDTATAGMREAARFKGLEPQFDSVQQGTAYMSPVLDQLRIVSGDFQPVPGTAGRYEGGMQPKQAESFLDAGLASGRPLEPFVNYMQPDTWNAIAGSTIRRMGVDADGNFRPDRLGRDWGGPERRTGTSANGQALLTQNAPQAMGILDDAALAGSSMYVPVARDGLSNAVGSLAFVNSLFHMANKVPVLGPAVLPLPGMLLESGPVVRGLAGRATPLADTVYANFPGMRAGAQYSLPPEAQQ